MPSLVPLAAALVLAVAAGAAAAEPQNFLYTTNGELAAHEAILERPDIEGAQIVYNWRALEPSEGHYDFSPIEADLELLQSLHKQMFIQVQDRFFDVKARNIPDYLQTDPQYGGGLTPQYENPDAKAPKAYGWVALQWNDKLRARYQALLKALAAQFDGKVLGVNLPETAIDVSTRSPAAGFSCDAYFAAELDNMAYARSVFTRSRVVQYVNFWPCEWDNDHTYMSRLFAFAAAHGIGLGGPDIVPYRKGQMKNSYPFFNQYKGKLPLVGMAIQEPTLRYRNDKTGKPFSKNEFLAFARDYLGADIVFWSAESPWLAR